jgi:hypothetical protein
MMSCDIAQGTFGDGLTSFHFYAALLRVTIIIIIFLNQLGRRLSACTGDMRETSFLLQRLSLTIQRFNTICFQGSFCFNLADFDT